MHQAYELLQDPPSRAAYDQLLRARRAQRMRERKMDAETRAAKVGCGLRARARERGGESEGSYAPTGVNVVFSFGKHCRCVVIVDASVADVRSSPSVRELWFRVLRHALAVSNASSGAICLRAVQPDVSHNSATADTATRQPHVHLALTLSLLTVRPCRRSLSGWRRPTGGPSGAARGVRARRS